jgi:hypothetical protein
MPIIPALGRRKQEDQEFKSSLGYIARLSFKKKERRKKNGLRISEAVHGNPYLEGNAEKT